MSEKTIENATHTVTVAIGSNNDSPDIYIAISSSPEMSGESVDKNNGHIPAAWDFVNDVIVPAIEEAIMRNSNPELYQESE